MVNDHPSLLLFGGPRLLLLGVCLENSRADPIENCLPGPSSFQKPYQIMGPSSNRAVECLERVRSVSCRPIILRASRCPSNSKGAWLSWVFPSLPIRSPSTCVGDLPSLTALGGSCRVPYSYSGHSSPSLSLNTRSLPVLSSGCVG